jgi:hypothetical protein
MDQGIDVELMGDFQAAAFTLERDGSQSHSLTTADF